MQSLQLLLWSFDYFIDVLSFSWSGEAPELNSCKKFHKTFTKLKVHKTISDTSPHFNMQKYVFLKQAHLTVNKITRIS